MNKRIPASTSAASGAAAAAAAAARHGLTPVLGNNVLANRNEIEMLGMKACVVKEKAQHIDITPVFAARKIACKVPTLSFPELAFKKDMTN